MSSQSSVPPPMTDEERFRLDLEIRQWAAMDFKLTSDDSDDEVATLDHNISLLEELEAELPSMESDFAYLKEMKELSDLKREATAKKTKPEPENSARDGQTNTASAEHTKRFKQIETRIRYLEGELERTVTERDQEHQGRKDMLAELLEALEREDIARKSENEVEKLLIRAFARVKELERDLAEAKKRNAEVFA